MNLSEFIKFLYGRFFFLLFKVLPLQNKVVFSSYWGKNCADNPKYISDELLKNNNKIKQVWIARETEKEQLDKNIKVVKWGSLQMIYELATAKVWVDNHTKPEWVMKRKKQLYIETWHGGLGMKKIESDLGEKLPRKSKKQIMHNSKMADLFISNSTFLTNIYKRAFWYNGPILECGFPKNDIFFRTKENLNEIKEKIYNKLDIPKDKKVVLYAPTFRNDNNLDCYDIDYKRLLKTLKEKFSSDFVCIVRLHPRMTDESEKLDIFNHEIINGSKYDNMQDLIVASDVFITDYSSGVFDFALKYEPAFLYAKDIEGYEKERGLYFDLNILPFPLAKSNDELESNIKEFDYSLYKQRLHEYFNLEDVGLKENGQASKKVSQIIEKFIYKGYLE